MIDNLDHRLAAVMLVARRTAIRDFLLQEGLIADIVYGHLVVDAKPAAPISKLDALCSNRGVAIALYPRLGSREYFRIGARMRA